MKQFSFLNNRIIRKKISIFVNISSTESKKINPRENFWILWIYISIRPKNLILVKVNHVKVTVFLLPRVVPTRLSVFAFVIFSGIVLFLFCYGILSFCQKKLNRNFYPTKIALEFINFSSTGRRKTISECFK